MVRDYDKAYTLDELLTAKSVNLRCTVGSWPPFSGTMNIKVDRDRLPGLLLSWHLSRLSCEYAMNICIEPNWNCPQNPCVSVDCRVSRNQSCGPLLKWMAAWGNVWWEMPENQRPHETTEVYLQSSGKILRVEAFDSDGA